MKKTIIVVEGVMEDRRDYSEEGTTTDLWIGDTDVVELLKDLLFPRATVKMTIEVDS